MLKRSLTILVSKSGFGLLDATIAMACLAGMVSLLTSQDKFLAYSHNKNSLEQEKNWGARRLAELFLEPAVCSKMLVAQQVPSEEGGVEIMPKLFWGGDKDSIGPGTQIADGQIVDKIKLITRQIKPETLESGEVIRWVNADLQVELTNGETSLHPLRIKTKPDSYDVQKCMSAFSPEIADGIMTCEKPGAYGIGFTEWGYLKCKNPVDTTLAGLSCPNGQVLTGINQGEPVCTNAPGSEVLPEVVVRIDMQVGCKWRNRLPIHSGNGKKTVMSTGWGDGAFGETAEFQVAASVDGRKANFLLGRVNAHGTTAPSQPPGGPYYDLGFAPVSARIKGSSWGTLMNLIPMSGGPSGSPPYIYIQTKMNDWNMGIFGGIEIPAQDWLSPPTSLGGGALKPTVKDFSIPIAYQLHETDDVFNFEAQGYCAGLPAEENGTESRVHFDLAFCTQISDDPSHPCHPPRSIMP